MQRFENIKDKYPMNLEPPVSELADILTSIVVGDIIIALTLKKPSVLVEQ